jgi:broad specificity phosphatase PhoE
MLTSTGVTTCSSGVTMLGQASPRRVSLTPSTSSKAADGRSGARMAELAGTNCRSCATQPRPATVNTESNAILTVRMAPILPIQPAHQPPCIKLSRRIKLSHRSGGVSQQAAPESLPIGRLASPALRKGYGAGAGGAASAGRPSTGAVGTGIEVQLETIGEDEAGVIKVLSLYLLRHGETEFSRQDRFCGAIDADLTDAGHRMAEAFAASYGHRALRWGAIYTSTRRRTAATAAPLAAEVGIAPVRDAGLDEIRFGDWQGRSKAEIAASDPRRFQRWLADPTTVAPAGESVAGVAARAMGVIERLQRQHYGENVLVVAHKTLLRVLACALLGIELRHYRSRIEHPVCGLTVIDINGAGCTLRLMADLAHLPPWLRARALGHGAGVAAAPLVQPEARGHLVGKQQPRLGQPQVRVADRKPAGAGAAGRSLVAPLQRVPTIRLPMSYAVDAAGGP